MIDRNLVIRSAVAAALLAVGFAGSASAQTVVNLTNMDATAATAVTTGGAIGTFTSNTNLDLLNATSALSSGGLFGAAYSSQSQVGYNQLNTIGLTNAGAVNPVVLGNQSPVTGSAPSVTINTIASAYNAVGSTSGSVAGGSAATINNINAAISSGVNGIVGGNASTWTGGYGPTAGNVLATGDQVGINTINGVGAAFAAGTAVTLSQLPGAPGTGVSATPSIIQGGALNMSTVNTLLAYTGAGSAVVNGSKTDAAGVVTAGNQTAVNTFNVSTLIGNNLGVASQQLGDGLNAGNTALQSVNRALAFSAGATDMNIQGFGSQGGPPSVTNLNQSAAVGVNALNLASGLAAGAPGAVTLSGLQSTGYNNSLVGGTTPTGGSVAIPVVSNQVVASTVSASGFMPTVTGAGAVAGQLADWDNTAAAAGASGAPMPGTANYINGTGANVGFLSAAGFNTNTGTPRAFNAGNVAASNIGQSANVTNNTVTAGTSAAPIDVTFGPAGYEQRTGTIGFASNGSGISNIDATTGIGSASVASATQAFQTANNTFQGTGNVSGTLTQLASGLNMAAGEVVSPTSTGATLYNKANGGSGQIGTAGYTGAGPYAVALGGVAVSQRLNDAYAEASYGPASVTSVTQTGNTFANVVSAPGVVDAGAAGTAAQSFGTLSNYGNGNLPLNNAAATAYESGNVAIGSVAQGLSMNVNQLSGTAGVNGSVAQQMGNGAGGIVDMRPINSVFAAAMFGQGKATLTNNQQVNTVSANAITSSGALGSASSPTAFSQVDSGTSTSSPPFTGSAGGFGGLASNNANAMSDAGAGATASSNGLQQLASLQVNSITGGTAAGGLTGLTTQTSTNRSSEIGNVASVIAQNSGSGTIGALGVMSGNATNLNTAQQSAQSLNTMSLTGANNGIVNQATFGTSNQTNFNVARATTNGGYGLTTGAQVATNAVNVLSAR